MSKKTQIKDIKASQLPMCDTKLFTVLQVFNVYELNRLSRFIASPYFNRNEKLSTIYYVVEASLRSQEGAKLLRGDVWQKVHPETAYNDAKFRKYCSDLLKYVERFLAQEAYEENSLHRADYLLQAVNRKKLEPLYKSSMRTAQRLSDQYFFRPASYFYHQYAYQREIHSMSGLDVERSKMSNVEQIAENLDKFYLAEKLRYYCDILSRKHIVAHEYEFLFMEDILDHVRKHGYQDEVPINFYYQIYLTHEFPDDRKHYDVLKTLINRNILQIPESEAKQIIDAALSYCIQKINQGDRAFVREIFELYQEALVKELLYVNGLMDPWNFRNVVITGLRLGEFDWVEKFIHQYHTRIDEKYRDNALTYNLANLYFYKGDYPNVLGQLREVEYDDYTYNLNSKTILVATYYELDELDPLLSLLASFSIYLRRNKKIPQNRKANYQNLIRFMRQLVRIPHSDKAALDKLKKSVESTSGVVNKDWLLEKITEMRG